MGIRAILFPILLLNWCIGMVTKVSFNGKQGKHVHFTINHFRIVNFMLFNKDIGKKIKIKTCIISLNTYIDWNFKKYCPPEALKPPISVLDGWKKTNSPLDLTHLREFE